MWGRQPKPTPETYQELNIDKEVPIENSELEDLYTLTDDFFKQNGGDPALDAFWAEMLAADESEQVLKTNSTNLPMESSAAKMELSTANIPANKQALHQYVCAPFAVGLESLNKKIQAERLRIQQEKFIDTSNIANLPDATNNNNNNNNALASNKIKLFDYQAERILAYVNYAIDKMNNGQMAPAIFKMPTGTGKTIVFSSIIDGLVQPQIATRMSNPTDTSSNKVRILIVVSRTILVAQTQDELLKVNPNLKIKQLPAGSKFKKNKSKALEEIEDADVVITTYANLAMDKKKRSKKKKDEIQDEAAMQEDANEDSSELDNDLLINLLFPKELSNALFHLVVMDEIHNATSPKWLKIANDIGKKTSIIGFTASDKYNTQKQGVKSAYEVLGLTESTNPIKTMPIREAIDVGAIAPVRSAVVDLQSEDIISMQWRLNERLASTKEFNEVVERYLEEPSVNDKAVQMYCTGRDPVNNMPFFGKYSIVFTATVKQSETMVKLFNVQIGEVDKHEALKDLRDKFFLKNAQYLHEKRRYKYANSKPKTRKQASKAKQGENKQSDKFTLPKPTLQEKSEFYRLSFNEVLEHIKTGKTSKYPALYYQYQFEIATTLNSHETDVINKYRMKKVLMGGIPVVVGSKMLTEGVNVRFWSLGFDWTATGSMVQKIQSDGRSCRTDPNDPDKITTIIGVDIGLERQVFTSHLLEGHATYGVKPELDERLRQKSEHSKANQSVQVFEAYYNDQPTKISWEARSGIVPQAMTPTTTTTTTTSSQVPSHIYTSDPNKILKMMQRQMQIELQMQMQSTLFGVPQMVGPQVGNQTQGIGTQVKKRKPTEENEITESKIAKTSGPTNGLETNTKPLNLDALRNTIFPNEVNKITFISARIDCYILKYDLPDNKVSAVKFLSESFGDKFNQYVLENLDGYILIQRPQKQATDHVLIDKVLEQIALNARKQHPEVIYNECKTPDDIRRLGQLYDVLKPKLYGSVIMHPQKFAGPWRDITDAILRRLKEVFEPNPALAAREESKKKAISIQLANKEAEARRLSKKAEARELLKEAILKPTSTDQALMSTPTLVPFFNQGPGPMLFGTLVNGRQPLPPPNLMEQMLQKQQLQQQQQQQLQQRQQLQQQQQQQQLQLQLQQQQILQMLQKQPMPTNTLPVPSPVNKAPSTSNQEPDQQPQPRK